ncbi:hypothetical protein SKAU_G00287150 [Synaphobranchus kaupii]|uniref:Reverse transcriptase domain-containing protein n=1 Tax=Synaphobranchus kaupii TaxID=118154 RepID=A0A9Q1EY76_SYNKA|nr:hypothetical protein SKAU_G00287150 [Synaphobranchus kaupii]
MVAIATQFYMDLFRKRDVDYGEGEVFLGLLGKVIPVDVREELEGELSVVELGDALRSLQSNKDQTCGVAGRQLGWSLQLVWDAISSVHDRKLPLMLLGLDQEKAFDRVSYKVLFRVLDRFGFGPNFKSGDGGIRGLKVPGGGGRVVKLAQYADETTLLLESEDSPGKALEIIASAARGVLFHSLWMAMHLRHVVEWDNRFPKPERLSPHYRHMVRWARRFPECKIGDLCLNHRALYCALVERMAAVRIWGVLADTWRTTQMKAQLAAGASAFAGEGGAVQALNNK